MSKTLTREAVSKACIGLYHDEAGVGQRKTIALLLEIDAALRAELKASQEENTRLRARVQALESVCAHAVESMSPPDCMSFTNDNTSSTNRER